MKNKKSVFIFILLSTIFISIPLFKFNLQYDDGIQHIARIIETMRSIKDGNFFTVIMSNLCNGFGYSWNLFYSPLTAYLPLIFKILGFSYENSLRIFMFLLSIASGYSMYFFMKKILSDKEIEEKRKELIAILGASLYILAPYRLTDMYIRVAVAELASFIFLPIIFNGLYTVINLKNKSNILCFGITGLILTHTLITFYTAFFCLIYVVVNIKKLNKDSILELIKNILFSLLLTAFYIVPLIESYFATKYQVFNQEYMVREDALINLKVEPFELLFIKEDRMAYFIGLPIIVGILLIPAVIKKIKDKKNYLLFLILGLVSVILTLKFIPFEKFPKVLKMMQFSFRLLEFSTFFLTTIASITLGLFIKKFDLFYLIIIIILMANFLIPIINNISFDDEYIEESKLIQGVSVTHNTGRVHAGCASFEYLPEKAFNNRNYIVDRENKAIALEDDIEIKNFIKDKTNCSFEAKGKGKIELPYIYYIGYCAKSNDKKIDIMESENGFCMINIESEDYINIEVSYTGTTAMKISFTISIITLLSFLFKYCFFKINLIYMNNKRK